MLYNTESNKAYLKIIVIFFNEFIDHLNFIYHLSSDPFRALQAGLYIR